MHGSPPRTPEQTWPAHGNGSSGQSLNRTALELVTLANQSLDGELTPDEIAREQKEVVRLVREQAGQWAEAAVATLAGVMLHADDLALKMQAADKMLDRSVGKPAQALELAAGTTLLEWMADPTDATDDDDVVDSVPLALPPSE